MNHPVLVRDWAMAATPRLGVSHLTRMAFRGENLTPLWDELTARLSDDAAGAGRAMDLSIIAQLDGNQETGLAIQKDALAYQRVFRSPCAAARPRLRVLALAAELDIGGNTPVEFLLDGSDVELATYYVAAGTNPPPVLPDHDIAIVVAPADGEARDALAAIENLTRVWPRPVLNRPGQIRRLERDQLFLALGNISGLYIPRTLRLPRASLADTAAAQRIVHNLSGAEPFIIRPLGSHAGRGLARLDDAYGLSDYLGGSLADAFFLAPYVNYASPDGKFRKYRIVFVGGAPYACHMAIADEWKVWYLNADMALSAGNRAAEAAFFQDFETGFAARHATALAEAARRLDLDYLVMDCAEMPDGRLLVFEADNSAIVHDMDPTGIYPYKPPQMRKIFDAFCALLAARAKSMAAA